MSDQLQKKPSFLSVLSSPFRASRKRSPSPNNAAQPVAIPSRSAGMSSGAPLSPEPIAGSSRLLPLIRTVDESPNQQLHQNTSNPQSNKSTSMFSDIGQIHIGGGNFNQNIYNIRDDNILKHNAFQSLLRSRDAAYNAAITSDNLARRPCTNDTRVHIINQIMAWAKEKDTTKAPPVYWLTGLAGLGKTTIAFTICERLNEAHLPFSSFFCSLQLDSRHSKFLLPTLCRDLAEKCDSFAANLLSVLVTNSKAANAGLRFQINELLAKPWQASIAQRNDHGITPIVVVDALDECDAGTEFLAELLHVIHAGQLAGIKFLVTSRPDPKIVDICKSFSSNAVCKLHEVNPADVQNDIEKYLREALPELKDEPGLALLSQRAGGFFIYATTAVRFISPPHSNTAVSEMRSHLQAMLNAELLTSHADSEERLLVDEVYERILGVAFGNTRARATRLRILHTIVCAESGIDVSILANLTDTDPDVVESVVDSLHAVLFVSPKDRCVYWYHASFPDFVFSQVRARFTASPFRNYSTHQVIDVFCEASAHHGVLARRCFSIMQASLHFNMCNLPSSYIFDSEVPGLTASINKTINPTLRYVSRYWAKHLLRAVPGKDDNDELYCGLKDFLCQKLLFWMEAMNLIGAEPECSSLLKDAASWLERGKSFPDGLLEQLADAANFSTFFAGSPASKSTPHLYISGLSMWRQDSVRRNWGDRFRFIPSISSSGAIAIPLLHMSTNTQAFCAAISPDGNRIVSGLLGIEPALVWDAKSGELLTELQGHVGTVTSVAFSPDGNRVVTGSWDMSVRVWDAKTGEQLKKLLGHTGKINWVAFSFDGNQIVSGSDDYLVLLWDAQMGKQIRELRGHTSRITSVAFSHDGNHIVSGSLEDSLKVWNAKTGECVREMPGLLIHSVAFSPDGNRIVDCSMTSVRVWDTKTGELLRVLDGSGTVLSVAFSFDGNRIVSGSVGKSVRVWDANTGDLLRELHGHTQRVKSVAFSRDGNQIVSCSWDKSVRVWDAKADGQLRQQGGQGHTGFVISVVFSPDGNRIVSGSHDNSARVWDAKSGDLVWELQGHDRVISAAFSPDGNRIISVYMDKTVQEWDAKTGNLILVKELRGHIDHVGLVAFSPDGKRIVVTASNSVWVWDAKTGNLVKEMQGHTDWIMRVAFSPDGNRIVSGSKDQSIRLWDAKTNEQHKVLLGHNHMVNSVAFSSDSSQIVSCSWNGSLRLWDANTGTQLRELQVDKLFRSIALSPDGSQIVSGTDDVVQVRDAKTGALLSNLQGHSDSVNSIAFSSDGSKILTCSWDKSVRVWENVNHDASWIVNEDGWILSAGERKRLVWVPSTICKNNLLRPPNILIISPHGSVTISFSQCKLGTSWGECYTP